MYSRSTSYMPVHAAPLPAADSVDWLRSGTPHSGCTWLRVATNSRRHGHSRHDVPVVAWTLYGQRPMADQTDIQLTRLGQV